MDARGLVEALEGSTGGTVVVKVGDQYLEVQSVMDWKDAVCINLGGAFLPQEGGGTAPDGQPMTKVTEPTSVDGERGSIPTADKTQGQVDKK